MTREKRNEEEGRERVAAQRDADAHTTEPVEAYDTTARPGTLETGKPDRDQLGEGDRMDLREKITGDYQPPETGTDTGVTADFSSKAAMERARPSESDAGRMDRSELTGQRSQTQDRTGHTETDTQGSQQTRRSVGTDTESARGGRTVPGEEVERPRPDRDRREEREVER